MIRQRDYLSWSQYSLWTKSKREFWKRYGLGEDRSMNKNFAKGNELADALEYNEDGSGSNDELLELVLTQVPKLDFQEHKIETCLSNGEKILSFLDSCAIDMSEFYEYKTGKVAWTQELVQKHEQLLFYATSIFIQNGRNSVPSCKLIWVETEQTEENGLKYTGVVEEFTRFFEIEEILKFEKTLISTIEDIENWEYIELEIEDDVMDRYIELSETIKAASAEMDLIRLGIQLKMDAEEVKYASATNGKFSMTETKSWTYSEDLTTVQSEFAKQIKIAQAQEQKDGIAKCELKPSLRFSINKK